MLNLFRYSIGRLQQRVLLTVSLSVTLLACSSSPTAPSSTSPAVKETPRAASSYENQMVRRPGSSPEDAKVYLVQNGKKRWVVNAAWLTAHGYRFPEDVREVLAGELDVIPLGEPIQ